MATNYDYDLSYIYKYVTTNTFQQDIISQSCPYRKVKNKYCIVEVIIYNMLNNQSKNIIIAVCINWYAMNTSKEYYSILILVRVVP